MRHLLIITVIFAGETSMFVGMTNANSYTDERNKRSQWLQEYPNDVNII